ncbi:MAG: hypothetical protein QXV83_02635 [Candidatus Anstonellaceae archaeon]
MDWEAFKERKLEQLAMAIEAGEVDRKILPLLNLINQKNGLVSSSSCSGRILILKIKKSKKDAKKLLVWHREISLGEFKSALRVLGNKNLFWLRVEPFILHILAKDIESAKKVLVAMKLAGIKRGGIVYISKKITIEIMGHGQLIVPLYLLKNYKQTIKVINSLMKKNTIKLKKFEKSLQAVFNS